MLFFHFRVTNSKLKNKKIYFELFIRKIKKQNLGFEAAWDFFIEIKYTIQNDSKKNVGMLDFVILDIDLVLNTYCFSSWNYSSHALCYAPVFFEKKLLLLACFVDSKYALFYMNTGVSEADTSSLI